MRAWWDRLGKFDLLCLCVMVGAAAALAAWVAGHSPGYWRGYREGHRRGARAPR